VSEHRQFDFGMANLDGVWCAQLQCEVCFQPWPCLTTQLAASRASEAALREALVKYGAHTDINCYPGGPHGNEDYHCECGLNAILAAATESQGAARRPGEGA